MATKLCTKVCSPLPDHVVLPLTSAQKSQPFIVLFTAGAIWAFGVVYEKLKGEHKEMVDGVIEEVIPADKEATSKVTSMIAALTALSSSVLFQRNQSKSETAIVSATKDKESAMLSPPTLDNGETCPYHTTSIAVQQFISRNKPGDVTLALAIIKAIEDHGQEHDVDHTTDH